MSEGGLVLPFDSDDPEFTRGVEVGIIYAAMRYLPPEADRYVRTIHTSNLEMVLRMAERAGWSVRPEAAQDEHGIAYDEWTMVTLERVGESPDEKGDAE